MADVSEPLALSRSGSSESKANILLVDDNPANLLSLRAILEDLGQNLVEAHSGEEALQRVQSDEFAVVLLDVLMPGTSGFDTAKLIRGQDRSQHTPIIFLTANDINRPQVEEAYALGAVDFLVKPLPPVVLQSKVRGFVELFLDKQGAKHEADQLRLLVHGTTEYAIFMLDPHGRVVTWNAGAERIKQYRADEIIGQHFSRFYPPDAIERGWPAHELKVAVAEGQFEDEGWRIRKDGSHFWANVVITALRDEQGRLRGFSKVTRDLTERKRTEESLRQSEERFRLLVEGAKDYAIFLLDPDGKVASWNAGAERIKRYRADEIIGQHFSRFYPQDAIDRGWPAHELTVAKAEGRFEDEGWRVRKDGTLFWANVVITALYDETGTFRGFSKITRDLTERRKSEENSRRLLEEATARRVAEDNARIIQEQRERLHVTLASIGDAVISTDAEGRVDFLNPVAEELIGWKTAEAIGRNLEDVFHIVNDDTRLPVENPTMRALREGKIVGLANHTILISREGTDRPIDDSAAPIRDAKGNVIGSVLVFRDVSEQRRAAQASRKNQELLQLIHKIGKIGHWEWNSLIDENKWSPEIEALYGLPPGGFEGGYQGWAKLLHPDDLPKAEQDVRRAMETGEYYSEFRVIWPDGSVHWLETRAHVFKDNQDKPVRIMGVNMDVTARKRGEEALREVEARFTAILNYSPSCIFAKDREGRYLLANKALGEFTGRDAADLLGRTDADVFPAEVAARFARDDADLLASGGPRIYEESFPHGDTTVTALTVKFSLVGADGAPYAVCGIATDISDQKRAQDALRESERRWRNLAEALPNLVWTDLPDGQCDYLSSQWATYTGIPESELLGLTWLERVIHPDDRERTLACWMAAVEDKAVYDLEYRIRRHDGQYHWFKTRGVPIRDGQGRIVKWFGTCTDIEDQKQVMEELRQSEERFARFMQHLPGLAWVKDSQGRYVFANDAALKAFRHSRNELLGKTDAEVFSAKAAAQFRENDGRALASGTGVQVIEILEHEDGIVHHSIVSKFPIPGRDGRPALVGGVAIDITDLKRAEEALRDADRRKDEFLATLAHELRNPLAPIRNSLQILKMPRLDAATVERSRETMERQVHQLVRLVDDLLDVSRVMRGKIELRKEQVELSKVVARAVETVQPLIEAQGHELTVNLPPESLPLDADPVRLAQVVGNLLTNAAKYTEASGRIWLTAQREGEEAVLRLRDSGIGIAPDMLPHVFELFVQADHSSTKAQGGLGIGLTLVKNLIEMHQGTVEAYSEGLGKGCEFVVRLPLTPQEDRQPIEEDNGEAPEEPSRSSGHRLLVVDDNVDAAESLAMLLRLKGHEVQVAHDGPSGLEQATSYRPDMVFLDIGMPGLDGYEVARRLRQLPGLENVRLAALTGWGQQEDRRRTAEAGFDHHLVKPAEPEALERLLAELNRPEVQ